MSAPAADDKGTSSAASQKWRSDTAGPAKFPMRAATTLATRLAIAMILLVAVTVAAVGWLGYRNTTQAVIPRVLERVEAQSRLLATNLESYVAGVRGDLVGYRAAAAINGLIRAHVGGGIDPVDGVSEQTWRERIAARLAAEIEAKPIYGQFRIIGVDNDQRELVHVDRSGPNGAVRIAPDGELERKSDRAYFQEAIRLAPGEIYVSPIELATRQGGTRASHAPTLRVAMPLFTADDKPFGIIVANVDMRPALDRVRATTTSGGEIHVVNARGDYLVHPDRMREFGAAHDRPNDWRKDFPYFGALTGTLEGSTRLMTDSSGRPSGAALAPTLLAGKEWVAIIETIPAPVFGRVPAAIQKTSLLVGVLAVLAAAALAVLLARSLTRPIGRLTEAVQAIGSGRPADIPVDASGETGVLARAFARMVEEMRAKTAALEREIEDHRRTEAARSHHAARESLFSAAVESSDDAIVMQTLDAVITGWNPAAERLYGYTAEEAIGKPTSIIVPPDRREHGKDYLRRIARGEPIERFETVRLRKDGTPVEISLGLSPIKGPAGEVIGASGSARSLTEARRAERALQNQLEERRQIFETSQDLIMVMDARAHVAQISPSSQTILGYRPDEMIGRSGADFIHPAHLEQSRAEMRAMRRGERVKLADTRCLHKNGHEVWLSWLGSWSEPAKRFFFVGRDMTEARLAQESLRESERLARNIVETSLDAFVQTDETGSILNWNSQAEQLFGWRRDEVLGKSTIDLIVAESERERVRAGLKQFLAEEDGTTLNRRRELMCRRRDGKEFRAELSVTALKRREGLLFNVFYRDLTDKIAAEERIRHAEKMEAVGQLTGGVAHDFNNILTVITGTIEILAEAVAKEPQLAAITKMIDEAAARGADLTQHLLAFARKQPLQPREIDINSLIVDTAKLLRPTLGEQIQIESVFEDENCVAIVDPNQLTTAILNLALNARDAMPGGGKLIVETGAAYLDEVYAGANDVPPGHYVLIAVSDTGTGIPAHMLPRVFDPFFTSKGPGKGTGLGLSMVYGFIKQSAGHIKIYSEEGHGTTIKMYLPPGKTPTASGEGVTPATIEGGHETILVVEDDRLVRDYVLAQLHSLGYVTLQAADAAEALAIVAAGKPFDLLFTDVIMPGKMNGRQLADELMKTRPDLKVVYTSGYTENAIIHHGRLDSGVMLLAKPYRKSDLARIIRKALSG
ncbi:MULTISPECIES: PAS domain S-box protein [Bradyrhizobium]|uniref:PAS domain S-box protein n=1 Tax=Bradyrhizobium TaxID=374 RepID=UPI00155E1FEC|nr:MULTISPECIES: PAS domain S-box protein [Bradyrhizobium]MDD1523228.1 hybrid sensor histidine kinase/response regulator [Bradyrhizobium sp. WBAH30]MDD1547328.1 hybrid sensor histidine kinase/response regulator [Bradyrhizobium sp. WBAH41]MDD1560899.1 hybrid sensor histidine kinase/response regulator [Bradyrhizobium sp. WBAH23]MDD1568366.1 hybrid sensor histidine kinase/response regulator [Bradyrhizobium sp. WBAH33]MDD1594292.1 hybrid sensor histidine kinase/response regulator [Bradyrhizobium s